MASWDNPWRQLLRRMFRVYVKLCHRVTCATRLGAVCGCAKQRQAAQPADSRDAICKYGVVADTHGYIARYATSREVR
jgi:hypothetical protein